MRIVSGNTTTYVYFVAVDATDFTTRETGLSSFTVYRSRNGGAAAVMTTPTINETDTTNMPGVYELLLDEDTTIDSGFDSQEMVLHITHAGMAPVSRTVEIYRSKITAGNTLGVASDGDISGNVDGNVVGSVASVTGAINTAAGTITTLDALDTAQDTQHSTTQGLIGTPSDFGSGTSTLAANLQDMADNGTATFDRSTDSLQAIRDRGDAAWTTGAGGTPPQLLQNTTIATLASQTSFTLTAGSADDDAYNGAVVVVTDQSTSEQKAVGSVLDYTGSSKTVTLVSDPGIFTMAVGDTIDIIANASTAPTAAAVADAVWDEAQSGHVGAGTFGEIATEIAAILVDTAEIGAAGAGLTEAGGTGDHLTAVPWNAAWDAEVQSEVTDALNAYDPPTNTEMTSAFTEIKGATFSGTTDSLEALRNRGDAAWITATGFSTHSAADVWSAATRTLTANTNLNDLDAAGIRTAVGLASANLDTQLAALPTASENATALLAAGDVDGYSVEESLKIIGASVAGKLSGAATTTVTIRAMDDSKARITATVDSDGNRSAVTLDETG